MILITLSFFLHASVCAGSSDKPPLSLWDRSYEKALGTLPPNQTTFLSNDYSRLFLVLKSPDHKSYVKTVSLNKNFTASIRVAVLSSATKQYEYTYRLSNKELSKDPVLRFYLVVPSTFDATHATSDGQLYGKEWAGIIGTAAIARQCEVIGANTGRYVAWVGTESRYELRPGQSRSGLGLKTSFLPGFTTAYVGGPFIQLPENWDVDATISTNFVWSTLHFPTIGPVFSGAEQCRDVRENFRNGLRRLIDIGVEKTAAVGARSLLSELDENVFSCAQLRGKLKSEHMPQSPIVQDIVRALKVTLEALK